VVFGFGSNGTGRSHALRRLCLSNSELFFVYSVQRTVEKKKKKKKKKKRIKEEKERKKKIKKKNNGM